jgi:hypothetical protein
MELYAQIACAMPRELAGKGLGWQARAVYTEAVLYCRENLRDGRILRAELMFWMPDMPVAARVKHLAQLTASGALQSTHEGWQVPEKVWRKWGKMRADVEAEREMASELGIEGNHKRWHVGDEGKPSPKCALCRRDRIGVPDRDPIAPRSPKPEPEPKPELKPKEESKPEPSSSSSAVKLTVVRAGVSPDDDRFEEALNFVIAAKAQKDPPRTNRDGWYQITRGNTLAEVGEGIRAAVDRGDSPFDIAQSLVGRAYARAAAKAAS